MDQYLIKQIISTLNRDAFSMFIHELWKLNDYSTDLKYQKTKSIGNEIFEQHYWEKIKQESVIEEQGYNLIIPFFQPIELFNDIEDIDLFDFEFTKKIKNYKSRITRRENSWQFWTDGQYHMPLISFVSNFEGIEKDFYFDFIIPKFQNLVEKINIDATIAVGSCDSFFELSPENTLKAFKNFIEKNQKQISLSFSGNKLEFGYFEHEKYLTSGLLKNSKSPYEPIFINHVYDKSEIIKEFEFLINNSSEISLERFLKANYQEIFGFNYDRIETQLWLRFPELDISNKNRRIDIFLRNSLERDWELVELKNIKKLTRTYRDIPTFTSEIHNAIQQARNYEKLFSQDKVKQHFAKLGIEYFYPEIKLIVGRKPDISVEEWRFLKTTNENRLKIITFDDLLESMKLRLNLK